MEYAFKCLFNFETSASSIGKKRGIFSENRKVLSKVLLLLKKRVRNLRDITQGRILLVLSFMTMILYFWALFLAPQSIKFLDRTIRDWALLIPVMIIVYLFLVVVAWIGWAMATTPPSIPALEKNPKDKEKGKTACGSYQALSYYSLIRTFMKEIETNVHERSSILLRFSREKLRLLT